LIFSQSWKRTVQFLGFVGIVFVRALDAVPGGWKITFDMDSRVKISSMWVGQLESIEQTRAGSSDNSFLVCSLTLSTTLIVLRNCAGFSTVTVRGPTNTGAADSDGSLVQGQLVEIGFYGIKPTTTKVFGAAVMFAGSQSDTIAVFRSSRTRTASISAVTLPRRRIMGKAAAPALVTRADPAAADSTSSNRPVRRVLGT